MEEIEQLDNNHNQQNIVIANNSTNKTKQEIKLNYLKDKLIKFGNFIKVNLPIYATKTKQQLKLVLRQICKTIKVLWFIAKPYLIKFWHILIAQSKSLMIKTCQVINNKIMQLKQIRKHKKLDSSSYAGELKNENN